MSQVRTAFAAFVLALPLAACGITDPSTPGYATTADSATLAGLAREGGQVMYNELSYVSDQFPSFIGFAPHPASRAEWARWTLAATAGLVARNRPPGEAASPAPAAGPALFASSACDPAYTGIDSTGAPIDTDNDGIPDDWSIDWGSGCVGYDSAGDVRTTLAGKTRVQDTGLGFFSYKVTETNSLTRVEYLNSGSSYQISADGYEEGIFADTSGTRTMHLVTTESQTDSAGVRADRTEVTTSDLFHPVEGHVLALGQQLPAGYFSYSADYKIARAGTVPDLGENYHLTYSSPTLLHFAPGCVYAFDSGVFRGLLNGDATIGFDYTWGGCAVPTLTTYGTDQVPATIAVH